MTIKEMPRYAGMTEREEIVFLRRLRGQTFRQMAEELNSNRTTVRACWLKAKAKKDGLMAHMRAGNPCDTYKHNKQ